MRSLSQGLAEEEKDRIRAQRTEARKMGGLGGGGGRGEAGQFSVFCTDGDTD